MKKCYDPFPEPISKTAVWLMVQRYAQACALSHIKVHDFRRFVGTQLAKDDSRKAQKALGQKRIDTTARHSVLDNLEPGLTDNLYGTKGQTTMAQILYPDGTSKEVHPVNGDHFEYEELTQIVQGSIEMIPLPDGRIMTLNAEGRPDLEAGMAGLPRNEQATVLAGFPSNEGPLATLRGLGVNPPYYYVGPIEPAYIPGTVLVSTKHEVLWDEE